MLKAVATPSYNNVFNAPPAVLRAPTFRVFGDSIASQNDSASLAASGSTSMALTKYPYWWNLLDWMMGGQIRNETMLNISDNQRYGSNSGVGGADMADVLTATPSLDAILGTMTETYLIVCIGTNDANESAMTLATLNSRWETVNSKILNAGKIPVWTTILPRNAVDGANDWSNTTTSTANRRKMVAAHNHYRRMRCRELGLICSDWHEAIMAADGQAATGHTTDGLHPGGVGSWKLALHLYNDIAHLIPHSDSRRDIYDAYDATYNPYGNALNGALTGSGGATSAGSGTGTINGTIPDNFQLQKSTSTSTKVLAEIVPRTDGQPGNVLQLTFTTDGAGSSSENWRLNYWSGASTSLSSYANAGDYLQCGAEFEVLAGHGGICQKVGIQVADSASVTSGARTTISFNATTKQILDSGNNFGSFLANRLAVVSGAANSANNGVFKITSAAAGVLQLSSDATIVDESAGNSITVVIPASTVATGGASTTKSPDDNTPVLYHRSPYFTKNATGNVVPRIDLTLNGTIAGICVIRIANPWLRKVQTLPTVLSFLAHDN